jgi:hypothetical protein
MSARATVYVGVLVACSLQALAEEPKSTESATTATTTAATEVVQEGESKPITDKEIDQFLKRQGYSSVELKGVMYYCRKEAPMGTRVKKSVCITGEEAKELRQRAKEEMRRIDQRMWKEE